ncbi:hypothetical protein BGZ58_001984 [Dissophora ornata]|nr:hypothetical protein BGZ58_001984 [Dissophora ornata]
MGHKTSDNWFTISLNEPYIVIPDPPSISVSSATSRPDSQQKHLNGTVVIRLSKPTKRDELPSDDLFDTTVMCLKSKVSPRMSSHISIPCAVFPQAGTIPVMLNLTLKGNATAVTKISIEMIESVFARHPSEDSAQEAETLIDERLVTRQSCSIQEWPSSTPDKPVVILKRLMFKVPELPLSAWSKSEEPHTSSCKRSSLDKGFCHASGTYAGANIRIAHSLHVIVLVRGHSSNAESIFEHDTGESETGIWIVGNQEYKDDEMNPPSYYRSFSTALVEGDKIYEMDQQAMDALQDDLLSSAPPPGYEEGLTINSARVSPTIRSWPDSNRISIDQFSLIESLAESTSGHDTYAHDLAAYTERYSYANHPVLAT